MLSHLHAVTLRPKAPPLQVPAALPLATPHPPLPQLPDLHGIESCRSREIRLEYQVQALVLENEDLKPEVKWQGRSARVNLPGLQNLAHQDPSPLPRQRCRLIWLGQGQQLILLCFPHMPRKPD